MWPANESSTRLQRLCVNGESRMNDCNERAAAVVGGGESNLRCSVQRALGGRFVTDASESSEITVCRVTPGPPLKLKDGLTSYPTTPQNVNLKQGRPGRYHAIPHSYKL